MVLIRNLRNDSVYKNISRKSIYTDLYNMAKGISSILTGQIVRGLIGKYNSLVRKIVSQPG